ncbi:hypothetical protein ACQUW5_05500 [Legionella sp. CNM-1927-20]|uniref:hypothetical protein n=1 Tax=Legionella sp. CNM-1927-20 TaxID=3422221 RepID=UPI00403A84A7
MKAVMSDRIKKILSDPEKEKVLIDALERLHAEDRPIEVNIKDIEKFRIKFASEVDLKK